MEFRKKTTATLLIAIFMISTLAAVVSAGSGIELYALDPHKAEWTSETSAVGDYSVKLTWAGGFTGQPEVRITLNTPVKVSEMSWSFWTLTPTDMESYACPIQFYADIDSDGIADKIISGNILKKSVPVMDQWYEMKPELWMNYGGAFYVWREDGTGFDFSVGPDPWAGAVDRWGDAEIVRVDLGYGPLGTTQIVTAFVDDLTINGVPYELELDPEEVMIQANSFMYHIVATSDGIGTISPDEYIDVVYNQPKTFTMTPADYWYVSDLLVDGATVTPEESYTFNLVDDVEEHTIHAVFSPYVIGISVDPMFWDFGSVPVGGTAIKTIIVTNTGDTIVDVRADITEPFFQDGLTLNDLAYSGGWNLGPTYTWNALNVDLELTVLSGYAVGTYTGTLVFEITPPQP